MAYTSKHLSASTLQRAENYVKGYFDLANENRRKAMEGGGVQRSNHEGKVFAYWQEHSPADTYFMVWNFRCMPPPNELVLNDAKFILRMAGPPVNFPDLNDAILMDVTIESFFAYVLREFDKAWEQPFAQKQYPNAETMIGQSLQNMCIGDLPFDISRCTAELRAERGWDVQDWPGEPWIRVAESVFQVKTPKQRIYADTAMAQVPVLDCPLRSGTPLEGKTIGQYYATFRPPISIDQGTSAITAGTSHAVDGASETTGSDDTPAGERAPEPGRLATVHDIRSGRRSAPSKDNDGNHEH